MNYSKQRELILNYVKSVSIHPSAEEVYKNIKQKLPNISLGTVYRNLDFLASKGYINKIKISDLTNIFDGNTNFHYHGICEKCGKVIDMKANYFKDLDIKMEQLVNMKILSHDIIFKVICSNCNNGGN